MSSHPNNDASGLLQERVNVLQATATDLVALSARIVKQQQEILAQLKDFNKRLGVLETTLEMADQQEEEAEEEKVKEERNDAGGL